MQVFHNCHLQTDSLTIESMLLQASAWDPAPLGLENKEFKTEMLVIERGKKSPAKFLTDSGKSILTPI